MNESVQSSPNPDPAAHEHHEQKWYVRRDGEVRGPFPAGLISRYVLLGRLGRHDEVSSDGAHWLPLAGVPHLIPDVLREAAMHPEDPEAREQLKAARRWADDARPAHHTETRIPPAPGRRGWLLVLVIVTFVAAVPFLLPKQPGVQEPQCGAPPAPGVVWRDCLMQGSELANANLAGAVLRSANLRASVLRAANLAGADLSYADLSIAKLRGANFQHAVMVGTDLRGSDLADADLSGADLSYADLSGALLDRADFSGARFDNAVWGDGLVCLPGSIGECRLGRIE